MIKIPIHIITPYSRGGMYLQYFFQGVDGDFYEVKYKLVDYTDTEKIWEVSEIN